MIRNFAGCLVILIGLFIGHPAASAQEPDTLKSIISRQIEAFRTNDAPAAFGFASQQLQTMFRSPDRFMEMVRRQYSPVFRPDKFSFGQTSLQSTGRPVQIVTIADQRGRTWTATYVFEQHRDGSWRIAAVHLEKLAGSSA